MDEYERENQWRMITCYFGTYRAEEWMRKRAKATVRRLK